MQDRNVWVSKHLKSSSMTMDAPKRAYICPLTAFAPNRPAIVSFGFSYIEVEENLNTVSGEVSLIQ